MAAAAAAVVTSCLAALPAKFEGLSLNTTTTVSASACPSSSITATSSASLSFSSALSQSVFSKGSLSMRMVQRRPHIGTSIVCEAAPKKKIDSAVKRARQAEKRRIYNKSRKSEIRTRMKKVLEALAELKKKPDAQPEEVFPIEKLIAEAYSVIDKAVRAGTLHRNTGARRKSRLARNKKVVEIHHGWMLDKGRPACLHSTIMPIRHHPDGVICPDECLKNPEMGSSRGTPTMPIHCH